MVEQAEVTGNTSMTSAELAPLVLTKAGQPFSDSTVGADALRIQGLLPSARIRGGEGDVAGRAARAEGRQRVRARQARDCRRRALGYRLGDRSRGIPPSRAETLAHGRDFGAGAAVFRAADFGRRRQHRARISEPRLPGSDGAARSPGRSATARRSSCVFAIHEGPQILIDHVLIAGNQRTSRDTIFREVQLKSGQPLSQQQEDETRARITALGLFRRVDISYLQLPGEPEPPGRRHHRRGSAGDDHQLRRRARRRPAARAVSRGTADAIEEFQVAPRGFFQVEPPEPVRQGPIARPLHARQLSAQGHQPQPMERPAGGRWTNVRIRFNEYLARLTYLERRISAYRCRFQYHRRRRAGGPVELRLQPQWRAARRSRAGSAAPFAISGRYGIDHTNRLFNSSRTSPRSRRSTGCFPQVRLSSVASSLIRDTRNDALEPTSGSLIGTDAELAASGARLGCRFLKTFLQGFSTGGCRVRRGDRPRVRRAGRPGDGSRRVGETADHRRRRSAGERAILCRRRYRRSAASRSIGSAPPELSTGRLSDGRPGPHRPERRARIPVRGGLGAVAFIDGGNVFAGLSTWILAETRGSVGFGLRYRSPVGPIRVDLGIKLDRRQCRRPATASGRLRLHISLGQAF